MKEYPSIQNSSKAPRKLCHIFIKYDGSNLRFEYSRKRGWYKFGTRHQMFDKTHETFGEAVDLFLNKYGSDLEKIFLTKDFRNTQSFIVFAEFFGAKSFAGQHHPNDPKDIILFDVNPIKQDILSPKIFLDKFGHLKVAECLGIDNMSDRLIAEVKFGKKNIESSYQIKTEIPEGVICKGYDNKKVWMCKIKTQQYFNKLKTLYIDYEKFWE